MQPIERLGAFYLGREVDRETRDRSDAPTMYDARDLTTHAVCVGMTGSGKTGLCVGLLEEAALDGVPALIIDPKGDIANLLLTFPELRPEDFAPWINPDDARRKGLDIPAYAAKTAETWRTGLAEWDQDGERIRRLRDSADFRIYTPGSDAGQPVSILASLRAPRQGWEGHEEDLREQIRGTVSALLGLAGVDADPMRSPEHILLANIFEHYWREGRDLDLATLITAIQNPPVRKLGVFDVDTFFPAKDRFGLAMSLNNIMASPGFAPWLQGDPLDVAEMLQSPDGRPRHAIFSIAHLDDAQRMFFVTLLLEQTVAWVRRQSGTTSLRALLYMDEVFGFLPPTANPPSKAPMLTLLKQARAAGLGVVLTTQNPVDLDYKALSNTGTWFIGKLQTEQDKARILEGLESASGGVSRGEVSDLIGDLGKRVFLLHNVHEDAPMLFQTRWAMSYLRGPLTRDQIRMLKPPAAEVAAPTAAPGAAAAPAAVGATPDELPPGYARTPPALPPTLPQVYLPITRASTEGVTALAEREGRALTDPTPTLVYEPRLLALARVGFMDRKRDVNEERVIGRLLAPDSVGAVVRWDEGEVVELDANAVLPDAEGEAVFAPVPGTLDKVKQLKAAERDFRDHLYQDQHLEIFHIPALKLYGEAGESEAEFLGRARLAARELRDAEVDKLRRKVQRALDRLEKKLAREERELEEDQSDHASRKREELLSAGETLIGMLGVFGGRKKSSALSSAARKRRMTANAKMDIVESEEEIAVLREEIEAVQTQFEEDAEVIAEKWDALLDEPDTHVIKPRRTDVRVDLVALAWAPAWEIGHTSAAGRRTGGRVEAWR